MNTGQTFIYVVTK